LRLIEEHSRQPSPNDKGWFVEAWVGPFQGSIFFFLGKVIKRIKSPLKKTERLLSTYSFFMAERQDAW
jgi:hypothetical protein